VGFVPRRIDFSSFQALRRAGIHDRLGERARLGKGRGRLDRRPIGAKTKDHVGDALHKAVCDGLTPRGVQDIIVTDWFSYYSDNVLKVARAREARPPRIAQFRLRP
jgi:hypothetical protein